ncbi:DNA repair protein (Tof1), putative [Talaromyces stipitatus ATCC 10500]|uniref:Topoisomerase 1-associated factor 1 n=1 Tax=Talaromyces stipitatus (strain ATCC 10500 / CBS 375.48 / QM 6759 / NRRL 1006) TaxID=441959 RepID=B8MDV6_TALSN|nr:DNA repair protein (Tof1), putative [Talaromyces stipitatus ATCC 10500]EED18335.1 DNA repair protein (Tof1), putative [Talaromyces stipitatus ATCC 10500]
MELDAVAVGRDVQVVDPEVRAHVYSLVTALGGFNGEDVSKYNLGDDALACLRDIKKWLRLYDDKTNRLDVARCLAEANIVNGDLLPILNLWYNGEGQKKKHLTRVALACLELLVPLTWPVEIHGQMTINHHRHTPYLQQAQVQYKRGILDQNTGLQTLRAVIQIGLPSFTMPKSERTSRDDGILKLMLYLLRNVAMISAPKGLVTDADEEETSRSTTINAFQQQNVFALILTMSANISEDFNFQDVVLLEILFHLVKGVDVQKLFMNDTERKAKHNDELSDLLKKESGVKREYAKNAPTRHGRFGTMIWVKRDDAKVSTVSGQDILKDGQIAFNKMDQTKKWNRPKHGRRQQPEAASGDFTLSTHLTSTATKNLRTFVEEFLDTGFNPLFTHVRKAIEREADRVTDINTRQFLYVVAWFLQAERERRSYQRKQNERNKGTSKEIEPDNFSLVASVLNQETFVFLNRAMQYSFDNHEWQDLNANMRCFTQILLTIQEMAASTFEEDQEIAENTLNRIFYEETTHDRIISIVRGYKDQGFAYLDACTELSHVFLRMLENYSKANVDMQVRSKRRARAKKTDTAGQEADNEENVDSEAEELADAARVAKERKFDFKRFSARFCSQKSIDTFVQFTTYYRDLDDEQLKRAHRFFYRVAFKQELSILLYRLDILNLFYRMIKGSESLDSSKPIFREWEEFVKQLTRRMIKKLNERPALFTELLFSKINATLFYLEYGHEKQTISTGGTRPPAELEVHPRAGTSRDEKLNVVVAAMLMDGQADLVKWLSEALRSAANERSSWEAENEIRQLESPEAAVSPSPLIEIKSDNDSIRTATFRNGRLRLLMTSVGLERLGTEDVMGASWVVPASLDSATLSAVNSIIEKGLENPVKEIDGLDPRDQLRRKPTAEPKETYQTTLDVDFGSESEGEDAIPEGPLFPPNIRSKSNALKELKEKRRKRSKRDEDKEPLDDAILEERRRNREENARARQAKIKSDLFVHDSDDESDEEADRAFFEHEEAVRKAQDKRVREALVTKALEEDAANEQSKSKKTTRRKRRGMDNGESDKDTDSEGQKKRRVTIGGFEMSDDEEEDDDVLMTGVGGDSSSQGVNGDDDTPPTSTEHEEWDLDKELEQHKSTTIEATHDSDSEDGPVAANRRRARAGFVIEDDSE